MVPGKLPVPGHPTNLDNSRTRALFACRRCVCIVFFLHFFSSIIFLFLLPLWETARYRPNYCLKGPITKTTNHHSDINKMFKRKIKFIQQSLC